MQSTYPTNIPSRCISILPFIAMSSKKSLLFRITIHISKCIWKPQDNSKQEVIKCSLFFRPTNAQYIYINIYTGYPRRNVPVFGRVFLMLKYTDITKNTYVQSWTVTEIMAREKCGLLAGQRTVPVSRQPYPLPTLSAVSYFVNPVDAGHWTHAMQVMSALWMVCRLVVRCC